MTLLRACQATGKTWERAIVARCRAYEQAGLGEFKRQEPDVDWTAGRPQPRRGGGGRPDFRFVVSGGPDIMIEAKQWTDGKRWKLARTDDQADRLTEHEQNGGMSIVLLQYVDPVDQMCTVGGVWCLPWGEGLRPCRERLTADRVARTAAGRKQASNGAGGLSADQLDSMAIGRWTSPFNMCPDFLPSVLAVGR